MISAARALAYTWTAFTRLYRQLMGGTLACRPRVAVSRWICLEALLAARRAEIVGTTLVFALPGRPLLVDLHAAHDVFRHDGLPPFFRAKNYRPSPGAQARERDAKSRPQLPPRSRSPRGPPVWYGASDVP